MSSKYIRLPEKTLRLKLEKIDRSMISMETCELIMETLYDYNHMEAACLAVKVEKEVSEYKKLVKEKEDEEKRKTAEEKAKNTNDDDNLNNKKLDFNKILSSADFRAVKDAFGVFKKNENDVPLYESLNDQFHDHMKTVPQLRMMRGTLLESLTFDDSKSFRYINTNTCGARSFEGYEEYFFICFRLFVDPDTKQCTYESLWIINTSDSLSETVIPFDYKYFDWEEVPEEDRRKFVCEFLKMTPGSDDNYKSEIYFR